MKNSSVPQRIFASRTPATSEQVTLQSAREFVELSPYDDFFGTSPREAFATASLLLLSGDSARPRRGIVARRRSHLGERPGAAGRLCSQRVVVAGWRIRAFSLDRTSNVGSRSCLHSRNDSSCGGRLLERKILVPTFEEAPGFSRYPDRPVQHYGH